MTINLPIAGINNSKSNAENKIAYSAIQNNTPTFNGKPIEIKNKKLVENIKWLGDDFTSAQQRLISGVTGIAIQPWFDLNNKRVDEDTRTVSTARTLGKIISGMATGVIIRWGLIKASEAFTKTEATEERRIKNLKEKALKKNKPFTELPKKQSQIAKWEQCLLPKDYLNKSFREIRKYRLAFGTVAAVGVMLFTNFLIDAPMTTYLTNKFVKLFTGKDPNELSGKAKGGK